MRHAQRIGLVLGLLMFLGVGVGAAAERPEAKPKMTYRWLFEFRELRRAEQVDLLLADMQKAAAAGYNGVVLEWNLPEDRKEAVKAAAAQYHLDLIPKVMWKVRDPNLMEGLPVRGARFVAHAGTATLVPNPAVFFPDGGFERADGDRFLGWDPQDKPGVFTYCDTAEKHGGNASVRMENASGEKPEDGFFIGKTVKVAPFHEYRVSVWMKAEQFRGGDLGIRVDGKPRPLQGPGPYQEHPGDFYTNIRGEGPNASSLCFAPFEMRRGQDWQRHSIIFNSLDNTEVSVRFGGVEAQVGEGVVG